MTRYIIFTGPDYYPYGGAEDVRDIQDELPKNPLEKYDISSSEWVNALDTTTLDIFKWVPCRNKWELFPLNKYKEERK